MIDVLSQPYLLESTLILTIGYLLYKLLFARDHHFYWNRFYLITLCILSLIVPLLSFPVFAKEVFYTIGNHTNTPITNMAVNSTSTIDILLLIYGIITTILFLKFTVSFYTIKKILAHSHSYTSEGIKYVITDKLHTPASLFNTIILEHENSDEEIIAHEKIHVLHKHSYDNLILELLKIIQWYNPITYLLSNSVKENHEFTADLLAAKLVSDTDQYTSYILSHVRKINSPTFLNTFNTNIKNRIIMLNKTENKNPIKAMLYIPLLLGIIGLFSFDYYPVLQGPNGKTINSDTIPGTYIDTISVVNPKNGNVSTKVIRVYKNELIESIDTVTTFDSETYEETVQVIKNKQPRSEIIEETKTLKTINNKNGTVTTTVLKEYPLEPVETIDTITTFDYDTYEETIKVVKAMSPRREIISKTVSPLNKKDKDTKFDNVEKKDGKIIIKQKGN